jgi:hypothetical protein
VVTAWRSDVYSGTVLEYMWCLCGDLMYTVGQCWDVCGDWRSDVYSGTMLECMW